MNKWFILALLLSYVAIGYGGYRYGMNKAAAIDAAAITAEQIKHDAAQKAANDYAAGLEASLAAERLKNLTLNQQLENAYEKVVDNCRVPDNLIRLRNQAINQ